ncbi:MAG TPA: hypothetical protein DCF93_06135 [Desulfuromonas sp.]|nr:hypothetical protein [Desulfuromonas sp.]
MPWRHLLAALTLTLLPLSACVLQPAVPPTPPGPTAAERQAALERGLAALPGAMVDDQDKLSISYPGEVLYYKGAVLPLPGGEEMLAPLAKLVQNFSEFVWTGVVQAATGVSAEYDLALAKKRGELLGRYFLARGVAAGMVQLTAAGGAGAPLTLSAQLPAPVPASAASAAPSKP